MTQLESTPQPRWQFDHHRLDAFHVAQEAMVQSDRIARSLGRPYGTLSDQLRRSSLSALLQLTEGAARSGADRQCRLRVARAEACEAAACIESAQRLGLISEPTADSALALLWRLCAMLTRLGGRR